MTGFWVGRINKMYVESEAVESWHGSLTWPGILAWARKLFKSLCKVRNKILKRNRLGHIGYRFHFEHVEMYIFVYVEEKLGWKCTDLREEWACKLDWAGAPWEGKRKCRMVLSDKRWKGFTIGLRNSRRMEWKGGSLNSERGPLPDTWLAMGIMDKKEGYSWRMGWCLICLLKIRVSQNFYIQTWKFWP